MSEPIDPRAFRQVLGQFCTGITIITTVRDEVPIGFACQSFAALSLEPPLVLFCPTKVSRSLKAIEASGKFCVNVLTESQKDVSARFGSKEPDKFAGIEPDRTTPAQWRDDLEAFLTTTTQGTWL